MRRLVVGLVVGLLGQPAEPPSVGQPDAALTRRLTPQSVAPGTYVVYRSDRALDALVAELRVQDPTPAPGAWKPERQNALDAFDGASRADQFLLAELYVGRQPLVARGSLRRRGARAAYTLISPYPDPSLARLLPGTMIIVFRVPF